jgi:hypothetical protein
MQITNVNVVRYGGYNLEQAKDAEEVDLGDHCRGKLARVVGLNFALSNMEDSFRIDP